MSANTSPRRINKKQSLSILSNSALNQLNNSNAEYKPVKERVISESTGLIKFSIKKPANHNPNDENNEFEFANSSALNEDLKLETQEQINAKLTTTNEPTPNKTEEKKVHKDDSNELLFQMAAKQREILDITENLKNAKAELLQLEKRYEKVAFADIAANETFMTDDFGSVPSSPNKITNVASTLKKSTSIMNITINPPKVNAQQFAKTQKQMSDTFNHITNNIQKSNIVSKGRTFFETNLTRNFQMGSGILNSIFEKEDERNVKDIDNDDLLLDENESRNFDYSVDFDLEKISKLNFNKKLNGTILKDLEEEKEEENEDFETSYVDTRFDRSTTSVITNEDYGGDAVAV